MPFSFLGLMRSDSPGYLAIPQFLFHLSLEWLFSIYLVVKMQPCFVGTDWGWGVREEVAKSFPGVGSAPCPSGSQAAPNDL